MSTETTATVSPPATVSFWSPFKYSVFVAIWSATVFADLGLAMQNVGASWLITMQTMSPVYVSLIVTATSLPMFLLGLPAGVLADIFDRRKTLLLTHSWMFLMSLAFAIFSFMGYTPPFLMLALSFCLAFGPALNETIWPTVVSDLVPVAELPSAISLNGVSLNVARAIGPALGGVMISYYAPVSLFALNALCFLVTLIVIYFWSGTTTYPALQTERFFSAMRIGINYMRYANNLHPVLIRSIVFTFGASALWGLLPVVIIQHLHQPASVYGLMLFFTGAGAISAALLLTKINSYVNIDEKVIIAITIFASDLLLLHFNSNRYVFFAGFFFAGIGGLLAVSGFTVVIQTNVPRWVLARALSIYLLIFQGGISLGALVWGAVASTWGVQYGLFGASIWMGASLLLTIPYKLKNITSGDLMLTENPGTVVPVAGIITPEGPVLVWVDYEIPKENIHKFTTAITAVKQLRMRNGASQVGIFQNIVSPTIITEFFIVESWPEYLLQTQRYTVDDTAIENEVLKYHTGSLPLQKRIMAGQKEM